MAAFAIFSLIFLAATAHALTVHQVARVSVTQRAMRRSVRRQSETDFRLQRLYAQKLFSKECPNWSPYGPAAAKNTTGHQDLWALFQYDEFKRPTWFTALYMVSVMGGLHMLTGNNFRLFN